MTSWAWALAGAVTVIAAPAAAKEVLVRDQAAYKAAVKALAPGDALVLADGEWRDFAAVFTGEGRQGAPITLRAEHPGKVVLTGRSSLAIAGKYLIVANLVFKNGYAPKDEVVATRVGKAWSEYVRLTGIVIDGFSNPDRRFEDHWVSLYGRAIRVDHSHFQGKQNNGAMLVVIRDAPYPLDNRVILDHNYFGPRPVLGSNGGETIRVGTSTESMSDSKSVIEDNWFERCDGEVEIVSIKSGGNIVRRNVIVDSQGAVVLRHGNGNIVERNVFLGHNLPRTGGVRIINERQTVRGNYMEGLGGVDFTSAITVMNGVPNGPINRYLPVKDALIANNSIIDAARVTLAAGADAERSQPPQGTRVERNLFTGTTDPFRAEASIAGIAWSGNVATVAPKVAGVAAAVREVKLARAANGLLYPTDPALAGVGAPSDLQPIAREATGVAWYAKPGPVAAAFGTGATTPAANGDRLAHAVAAAKGGDTIRLAAGEYRLAAPLVVARPVTLAGAGERTVLTSSAATMFQLADGGALRLHKLTVSGAAAPRQSGNAVIRSAATPMRTNYRAEIDDCRFRDMAGFDVLATTPATLAEDVRIINSRFADVSGAVIAGHAEIGRDGFYPIESVTIARSAFDRVGTVADLYRGGTDESTYGPRFAMTETAVADSGPILLSGVQETSITRSAFVKSKGVIVIHSVGYPHTRIVQNSFAATPPPDVRELSYKGPMRAELADNMVTR